MLLAAAIRFALALQLAALPRVNGAVVSGAAVFGMMIWLLYIRIHRAGARCLLRHVPHC